MRDRKIKLDTLGKEGGIPLLDFNSGLTDKELAVICRGACLRNGFFFVRSKSEISQKFMQDHATLQKRFFALSLEEKMKIVADENNRGYTPAYEEKFDQNSKKGDAKEGLYFAKEIHPDDPRSALPLHGPNQWPSEVCNVSAYSLVIFTLHIQCLCFGAAT